MITERDINIHHGVTWYSRDDLVKESDLTLVENRQPGRPPNPKPEQSSGKKKGKK